MQVSPLTPKQAEALVKAGFHVTAAGSGFIAEIRCKGRFIGHLTKADANGRSGCPQIEPLYANCVSDVLWRLTCKE